MLRLAPIDRTELPEFRAMVEVYWRELMPHSPVIQDPGQREVYFQNRFTWAGESARPHWLIVDGERMGFIMYRLDNGDEVAQIHDFYVTPKERGNGYGSKAIEWLLSHFEAHGVKQIDLNVRVDNPGALAFWEAQGFEVALYRLRRYLE